MANRQARRAVRKAAAHFDHRPTEPARRAHSGLLSRTRDFHEWLAFIARVYGGARR